MAEKEYIERETLKLLFAGACAECRDSCAEFDGIEADCNQCLLNSVIKDAKSIPAADVRPVVCCRDCVHWTKQEASLQGRCELLGVYPTGSWYCANAKREDQ